MSFGSTITVTINAVAKVLPKINQDNFGSTYKLFETTGSLELTIRHSKESPQKNGKVFDRHNLQLTQVIYATPTVPETTKIAYAVLRNLPDDDFVKVGHLDKAFSDFLGGGTVIADLVSWQS